LSRAASAGKKVDSTVAAAADVPEWPETYDGNGGVVIREFQAGSISRRIAVIGRIDQYAYFVSQMQTKASAWAVFSTAKRRASWAMLSPRVRTRSSAIAFQWPGGV
jgi:hypothetical protein